MFLGLLKKDFLLVKDLLLVGLLAEIVLLIGGAAFFASQGIFDSIFIFLFFAYMFHIVLLPIAMMTLLRQEEKGQYWLHGTARASKLMFSKLMISLLVTLSSLILIDVLTLGTFFVKFPSEFIKTSDGSIPYADGFIFNGIILLAALCFTFLGLFLWSIYHSLNVFPALKKFRWLLVIVIYLVMQGLISWFIDQPIIQQLFDSWVIPVSDWLEPVLMGSGFGSSFSAGGVQIWPIIFSLLYIAGLYIVSCWLLDRKVEV
ncbi:hypothetical protein [Bacillus sp. FJAT-52991]|uniref:ABC transporter permease n=1 Tax=Bacillus kandeliae TaxID=3129297 RepID=A0ABZ2N342_9BACI